MNLSHSSPRPAVDLSRQVEAVTLAESLLETFKSGPLYALQRRLGTPIDYGTRVGAYRQLEGVLDGMLEGARTEEPISPQTAHTARILRAALGAYSKLASAHLEGDGLLDKSIRDSAHRLRNSVETDLVLPAIKGFVASTRDGKRD